MENAVYRFFFKHPEEAAIQREVRKVEKAEFSRNYRRQHHMYEAGKINALSLTPVLDGINSHDLGVQVFQVWTFRNPQEDLSQKIDLEEKRLPLISISLGKEPYECAFKYGIRREMEPWYLERLRQEGSKRVEINVSELILLAGIIPQEDMRRMHASLGGTLYTAQEVKKRKGYVIEGTTPLSLLRSLIRKTTEKTKTVPVAELVPA